MTYLFIIILFFIILVIGFSNDKQKHNNCYCGQSTSTCSMPLPRPNEPVVQELQYFCIKDKGYHVSVWPKDQGMQNLDYIEFDIAGMSYRENIDEYIGEHSGTLEAEPTNPYDANAVKILAEDGHHVGYVPKDMTAEVRKNSKLPCRCYFYIGENDGFYFSDCYIKIKT